MPIAPVPEVPGTEAEDEADLEAELGVIYREATEARDRFMERAKKSEKENPDVAALYREMGGTVLTLISDLVSTAGEALLQADEDIERLFGRVDGTPTESALMPDDAEMFLAYLDQVKKLVEGLLASMPSDVPAEQREALEALGRMTDERIEFTKEITAEDDEDTDEPDKPEEPEGEE